MCSLWSIPKLKRFHEQTELANVTLLQGHVNNPLLLRAVSAFLLLLNQENRDTPDAA
jgi:hypothetical protein